MYNFILEMWKIGKINESKVMSYVPKFITEEEAKKIINTPKNTNI